MISRKATPVTESTPLNDHSNVFKSEGKYYLKKGDHYFQIEGVDDSLNDDALAKAKDSFDDDYREGQNEGRDEADRMAEDAGGECAMSDVAGLRNCKGTNTMVEGAKILNQATQIAGSAAIQVMGQAAQAQASAEGTQSAIMRASAQTQKNSGTMQVTTGGGNVLMGALQLMKGANHKSHANQAANYASKACQGKGTGPGDPIYDGCVSSAKAKIASEQRGKAEEAMAGGAMSMVTGVTQVTQGGFNIAAGKQLEAAADQLAAVENTSQAMFAAMTPLDTGTGTEAQAAGQTSALTGSGEQSAALADVGEADAGTPTSLGDPFATNDMNSDVGGAPAPGAFAGSSTGGGGGGPLGMGGMGGGGTSPDSGGGEDGTASAAIGKMTNNSATPTLSGGGALAKVGGGGGGSGSGGGDLDLSQMLAALMPKNADGTPKPGMPEMADRGPAAAGDSVSLLDRNVNIFERISKTYKEKTSKGVVGE